MVLGKTGKMDTGAKVLLWGGVAILVILFVPMAPFTTIKATLGLDTPGATPAPTTSTVCPFTSATLTIGPMDKAWVPATSVSEEYARLYVNGIDQGLKKDSTTFGVNPATTTSGSGDSIALYYGENSSTYYANEHKFNVGCTNAIRSAEVAKKDEHKLIQAHTTSTMSFSVINDNGVTANADATNESMGTDETKTPSIQATYGAKAGFSPNGKIIISCKYNTTAYDSLDFNSNDVDISDDAVTPQFRVSTNGATGYGWESFSHPGIAGEKAERVDYTMTVASDSTYQPGEGTGGDIVCYFDDEDWYQHNVDGVMLFGAENNQDADVGYTTANSFTYYVE